MDDRIKIGVRFAEIHFAVDESDEMMVVRMAELMWDAHELSLTR